MEKEQDYCSVRDLKAWACELPCSPGLEGWFRVLVQNFNAAAPRDRQAYTQLHLLLNRTESLGGFGLLVEGIGVSWYGRLHEVKQVQPPEADKDF